MNLSLRDQLKEAGLIDASKARQAAQDNRKKRKRKPKAKSDAPATVIPQTAAEWAAAQKAERDAELNRKRQEKQEREARRAQVRQLVAQHRVARPEDSDDLYNFTDGKRIRRIPVDANIRKKLVSGAWQIVRCNGRYEIVPAAVADKIGERDPHARLAQSVSENTDTSKDASGLNEDDPYKDYVVPDDLMW